MRWKKRHQHISDEWLRFSLFLSVTELARACFGGGGGGGVCCPAAVRVCAPAVPICSTTGYSSSGGAAPYAAPYAALYPRPYSYAAADCSRTAAGCASSAINSASNTYSSSPSYPAGPPPLSSYQNSIGPVASAYSNALPPLYPVIPSIDVYHGSIPDSTPGPEVESTYDDINQEHQTLPPDPYTLHQQAESNQVMAVHQETRQSPDYPPPQSQPPGDQGVTGYGEPLPESSTSILLYENMPTTGNPIVPASPPLQPPLPPVASALLPTPSTITDYGGESPNGIQASPPASDFTVGSCEDVELRQIVEAALQSNADNLSVARKIESDAAARFGGRFNSIVSSSDFAYVNWYGKRNCQMILNNRQSLTWQE